MPKSLIKTFEDTVERHGMLAMGDTVLVALSGGPDSVCLLDLLGRIRAAYSLNLCAAHFNHKIRGEAAEQDARFAEQLADRKGLAFVSSSADVKAVAKDQKLSLEAAGRKLRYEFLLRSSLFVGATKIAVGHTADDQAETILMRLIRGAGPEGLAGIPPVRRLGNSDGPKIIRPLIDIWRSDIMRYVNSRKLAYRKDVSNESPEYLRNRIRLELLPKLENEYNPRIKQRLAAAASALAQENDFISTEARLVAGEIIIGRKANWTLFRADLLATLHPSLRKRVISCLVSRVRPDAPMLEASHYAGADDLIHAGSGKLDLPGRIRLEVSAGIGIISDAAKQPAAPKETFDIPLSGTTNIPALGITVRAKLMPQISSPSRLARLCTPSRQYFDLEAVRPPLQIRVRRPGDSFSPFGASGSKKLKDFFIDKKVPRFLRDQIPLLLSNGRIMWVMGYALDKRFILKPESTGALRVDYEKRAFGSTSDQGSNL